MSNANRTNHKSSDADIIRYNSVGLSYSTIGQLLGCHPTTVKKRLEWLKIPPADTRRAFMEDIYNTLSPSQRNWLETQLGPHQSIKNFVRNLLVERFLESQSQKPGAE